MTEIDAKIPLLHLNRITKSFPGVKALDNVSVIVEKGTVHALIGENGAGKSTLMKILIGLIKADRGDIVLNGRTCEIHSPSEALGHGISMIHQELLTIPAMTVAENVFLGREPCYPCLGVVNKREMTRMSRELFDRIGLHVDPSARMSSLSVAEAQIIEIIKAISCQSDIIVMDEPTSALSDAEVEKLFGIIGQLTAAGKAVIYISHKIDEIFRIADCVTVLRDGRYVDTQPIGSLDKQRLISMMVGRELSRIFPKEETSIGEVLLEVDNLSRRHRFRNISFNVRAGEILGIAGLMGSGRTELVETIFGLGKADSGSLLKNGKRFVVRQPSDAIANGIALVSEDRKLLGLNLKGSVRDNITIVALDRYCSLLSIVKRKTENRVVDTLIENLHVKTPGRNTVVNTLSGGNQQKVVIAKWLLSDPDVLILDEPTRGIDVGAKAEIHAIMNSLAKKGKAIIMISSEMPEILGMSDRVLVLHEGRITGEFTRAECDQELIMACATGHTRGEEVA